MKTLFIVNPTSGRDVAAPVRRRLLDAISSMRGADAHVLTKPGQATHVARTAVGQGYDQVVVAAGDGTLNEVVNGVGDSGTPIGLIPLGTGNVFASELGLQVDDLDLSLAAIVAGRVRRIDLGKAGDTRFLLMAGFGLDAEVVQSVPARAKGIFGKLAYAPMLVRESVRCQPSLFTITLDNETKIKTEAYNVIVCNCACYAPNLRLAPDASKDDGLLDVLVFANEPAMKLKILGWLGASLVTNAAPDPGIARYRTAHVRVDAEPCVKMQLDGDVRGESGIDVEVLPQALNLIVP